jgi:hypothetical protein
MRALLLAVALGFAVSCGSTRNSDYGQPAFTPPLDLDAGFADGGAEVCGCPGGLCCGPRCCELNDLCCEINGQARCVPPIGVSTTCNDFGGTPMGSF